MLSRKNLIYFIVLFLVFFRPPLTNANESSPQYIVERLISSISKLKIGTPLSLEELEKNKHLSSRALALLDLKEVSQKSLGKYWGKRTSAEKSKFHDLLEKMFIKEAFPSSGKFFSKLKLVYGKTVMKKLQASVPITVIHKKEGEISINFHLKNNDNRWQIVDVDLDEISMRNNVRSQFYKIIANNGFQEVIRRMEEKIVEAKN
jgi:phospholipid transport system substrate-binding protein